MFEQCIKTGDGEGETKDDKQKKRRNLDHVTWNDYGENFHCVLNNEWSTQKNIK